MATIERSDADQTIYDAAVNKVINQLTSHCTDVTLIEYADMSELEVGDRVELTVKMMVTVEPVPEVEVADNICDVG